MEQLLKSPYPIKVIKCLGATMENSGLYYQSNEAKAFALVDEDLAGFSIFRKQLPEVFLRDIVGQVPNKQAAPLRVRLFPRFQEHRQCSFEFLFKTTAFTLSTSII